MARALAGVATALFVACYSAPPRQQGPPPLGAPSTPETVLADPGPTRAVHDRDFLPAAVGAIEGAADHVRVAQYLLYEGAGVNDLVTAISGATARGVRVQVLADQEGPQTESMLAILAQHGADTAWDSRDVTLHAKLIVADDVVLVGSHNWSPSAMRSNHEGSVLVNDAEIASWYAAWFDALWAQPDTQPPTPLLERTDLVPLADRQVMGALVDCMDSAEQQVDLVLYALAWNPEYPGSAVDQALMALERAAGRGVDVRVVLDSSSWIVDNEINDQAIERLRVSGVDVWLAPSSKTTHAKVLRCDERLIVSDANWSYSGLDLMHGTSLQTELDDVVWDTVGWIEQIRQSATPVP